VAQVRPDLAREVRVVGAEVAAAALAAVDDGLDEVPQLGAPLT
jgi:hypothetical protein